MEDNKVAISPGEIMTWHRNSMEVSFKDDSSSKIREVSLLLECRVIVNDAIAERYALAEHKATRDSASGKIPERLPWEITLSRKAPLSFETEDFSIEYVAIVGIREDSGSISNVEIPLKVVPGRIDEADIEKEKARKGETNPLPAGD